MTIFSKIFGDVIILIIRVNADKRMKKNSGIFSIKNLEYTFVLFFSIQPLRWISKLKMALSFRPEPKLIETTYFFKQQGTIQVLRHHIFEFFRPIHPTL